MRTKRGRDRLSAGIGEKSFIVGWANTPGGFWDKPPRESPIENLYLTGHWTRPGGGVSTVLLSGMKVAQSLLKG